MPLHIAEARKQRRRLGVLTRVIVKARVALDGIGPVGGADKCGPGAPVRIVRSITSEQGRIIGMMLEQFVDTSARLGRQTFVGNRSNDAMSGSVPCNSR